jgi:hypothetical protein
MLVYGLLADRMHATDKTSELTQLIVRLEVGVVDHLAAQKGKIGILQNVATSDPVHQQLGGPVISPDPRAEVNIHVPQELQHHSIALGDKILRRLIARF